MPHDDQWRQAVLRQAVAAKPGWGPSGTATDTGGRECRGRGARRPDRQIDRPEDSVPPADRTVSRHPCEVAGFYLL